MVMPRHELLCRTGARGAPSCQTHPEPLEKWRCRERRSCARSVNGKGKGTDAGCLLGVGSPFISRDRHPDPGRLQRTLSRPEAPGHSPCHLRLAGPGRPC